MAGDNDSNLGKMLKQRRIMKSLTLNDLSEASNVSASHLGRIERGERFPSAHILRRIAAPLQMEEAELMSLAGFLSPEQAAGFKATNCNQLDPYVSMVLSQEPAELQRAVVSILTVLKGMARSLQMTSERRSPKKNQAD